MTSWDDFDRWGRQEANLAERAATHLKRAYKEGDSKAAFNWGICYDRHIGKLAMMMQFKRVVLLDIGTIRQPVPGEKPELSGR